MRLSFAEAAEFMRFYQNTLDDLNKRERELLKRIDGECVWVRESVRAWVRESVRA